MKRGLVAALFLLALVECAGAERWWVRLPRAQVAQDLKGFASPPRANQRALQRRLAKGDAERMELLLRGPDLEQLQRLAADVDSLRYVSRWLSAVSCELSPARVATLRRRYGDAALVPMRSLRRDAPDSPEPDRSPPMPRAKTHGALDYGPSADQNSMIQVDRLHAAGLSGRGLRILLLDTGFLLEHPAFSSIDVVAAWDFVQGDGTVANDASELPAQHAHGTGVLGLLAGYDPGSLIGPAFGAELLLAKTEDLATESRLEEDHFVAALEWGEALGADLCSASLGYRFFDDGSSYPPEAFDGDSAVTTRAMDALVAMGVVAIAAVGNRGGTGEMSLLTPADGDSVLSVGSVRADSLRSSFSSRGPTYDGRIKPDVMARGTNTVWPLPEGGYSASASGTSTATPQVAGAAALLMEAHPEWNPMEVVQALRATATRASLPDSEYGWGIVRAHAAVFDLHPPEHPLPFELLFPSAAASLAADRRADFRWRRARDLQSPAGIRYELQLAADEDFASPLQRAFADGDSAIALDLLASEARYWRVVAWDPDGHRRESEPRTLTVDASQPVRPASSWVWFRAARPNPFRDRFLLPLELRQSARLSAAVFDARGRTIRSWSSNPLPQGLFVLSWDALGDDGDEVAAGAYWLRVRVEAGGEAIEHHQRILFLP